MMPWVETMGHTIAPFRFRAPGRKRSRNLDLLVDTGSTYTWIDARLLRDLGIAPTRLGKFETIEGREAVRRLGEAVVSYGGDEATTIVVFARPTDAQVLGVHALEGLRFGVDPATKRLRRLRTVLAV
ncbi:MAG TPA: retroviral-like aspartic protease family protein [Thermoplasmata archaeon]|nr:retroviral-like aspartic protease family protein [Thermoplasmata archaeon]